MLSETLNSAIMALKSNKARSFLTMLGVIIGVFSVVTLISLGRGIENYITDEFDALGTNLLFISPGKVDFAGDPATSLTRNKLEKKHIDLINKFAEDSLVAVSPYYFIGGNSEFKTNSFFAEIIGVSSDAIDILNYDIVRGRKFNTNEEKSASKVAIIGVEIQRELFGNTPPVGQKMKLGEDTYEVIGLFAEKGTNYDDQVIVPYTSAEETFEQKNYSSIVAKVADNVDVDVAMKQTEIALLRDLEEDEFSVLSQQDLLASIQEIFGVLTIGLGLIASISLLVGGIGIMNIMLVSVNERTREIGLLKALGATPFNIGSQFLTESVLLSVVGGLIGLLLGYGASLIARSFIRTEMPLSAVLLSVLFAITVGVIFGTYPALQAGDKDPIESLRYE